MLKISILNFFTGKHGVTPNELTPHRSLGLSVQQPTYQAAFLNQDLSDVFNEVMYPHEQIQGPGLSSRNIRWVEGACPIVNASLTSTSTDLNSILCCQLDSRAKTILSKPETLLKIAFNQSDVIKILQAKYKERKCEESYKKLFKIQLKYGGLCELVCNQVLQNNLMDLDNPEVLTQKLRVEDLAKPEVLNSHMLSIYSVLRRLIAFLFSVYPDNIFSFSDQYKLFDKDLKEINVPLLQAGLEKIEDNTTLKLEVFSKHGLEFIGHSLLVKKIAKNNFSFFDPNSGIQKNLTSDDLCACIKIVMTDMHATDLYFLNGKQYLRRLENEKVFTKACDIGIVQS